MWSRSDRPARLIVEYSTTPSFTDTRRIVGPAALEDTDFTARVDLTGLPAGPAHLVSRAVSGSRRSAPLQRAGRGQLSNAGRGRCLRARRRPRRLVHVLRRLRRAGLGHRSVARRHAAVRRDAEAAAGRVHPPRRHDLRRPAAEAGSRPGRRIDLAQPRHRGEVQAGADARRLPGLPPLQPAGRAHAALQRRGLADRALGRSRGARQLVSDRAARCRSARST